MRIVTFIFRFVSGKVSQPTRVDWRVWIVGALLLYFSSLGLANFIVPYTRAWNWLGVPTMTPTFADLRAVLAGFECTRQGHDVLYSMPCDPYGRGSLAYPRLWMALKWTGLDLRHSIPIGVLLAVSLYAGVLALVGRLNRFESFVYIMILCSPPAMLLVERGNVDILMLDLLFVVLTVVGSRRALVRMVGYMLILVPSFLKLMPIFAIGVVLKEKQRWRAIFAGVFVSAVFIAYCVVIREEMRIFSSFYGYTTWFSSGARILPVELYHRWTALLTYGMRAWKDAAVLVAGMAFIAIFVKLVIEQLRHLFAWYGSSETTAAELVQHEGATRRMDAFRIGSCIYLGTFFSTVVFDYKLMFLILVIPQLLFWIKHDRRLGPSASVALVGIIAMFYAGPFLYRLLLDEMINWSVAAYLIFALLITLPTWAKTWAKEVFRPARVAHDLPIVGPGGDLEAIGQTIALDREQVIAARTTRPPNAAPIA